MSAKDVQAYNDNTRLLDTWYATHDHWTPEEDALIDEGIRLFHRLRPIEQYYLDPQWRRDVRDDWARLHVWDRWRR